MPRKIVKLRNLLLDKFDGMGGNLRVNVRRTLSKYDVDGSGELERAECVSALQGLLNAIQPDEIADLIDDIDTDKSQTLTVDEITAYLLAAQDGRDPQDTSLKLAKKKVAR